MRMDMDRDMRRRGLDALKDLNELQAKKLGDPETLTRIQQYELAFRMQTSIPEVMDFAGRMPAVAQIKACIAAAGTAAGYARDFVEMVGRGAAGELGDGA